MSGTSKPVRPHTGSRVVFLNRRGHDIRNLMRLSSPILHHSFGATEATRFGPGLPLRSRRGVNQVCPALTVVQMLSLSFWAGTLEVSLASRITELLGVEIDHRNSDAVLRFAFAKFMQKRMPASADIAARCPYLFRDDFSAA